MASRISVAKDVWDRVFEFYAHVAERYAHTWDEDDTDAQIDKIYSVLERFPSVSQWSRVPNYKAWCELGYLETWQHGCPWHFAYTREEEAGDTLFFVWHAEHEDVLANAPSNKF